MKTDKISRLISALGQAQGYETQQPKPVQPEAGAASVAANTDAVKVASTLTSQTAEQNEEAAYRAKVESIKARYEAGEYKVDSKATAVSIIRDLA